MAASIDEFFQSLLLQPHPFAVSFIIRASSLPDTLTFTLRVADQPNSTPLVVNPHTVSQNLEDDGPVDSGVIIHAD